MKSYSSVKILKKATSNNSHLSTIKISKNFKSINSKDQDLASITYCRKSKMYSRLTKAVSKLFSSQNQCFSDKEKAIRTTNLKNCSGHSHREHNRQSFWNLKMLLKLVNKRLLQLWKIEVFLCCLQLLKSISWLRESYFLEGWHLWTDRLLLWTSKGYLEIFRKINQTIQDSLQ